MKRLFPAPLLSLALFAFWLVLNESLSMAQLALAVVVAVAAPVLSAPLRPLPVRIRRPGTVLRLLLVVGHDVLASNVAVALGILRAGGRPPNGTFVDVPLDLRDPHGLAALAMITTVVPGTVWSELALDRSMVMLHVFDLDDRARFIAHYKDRYERPLMEIFE